MQRKLSPEELAQQAIGLLEAAEQFESEENWAKALQTYQTAADYLKQSGFLAQRIDDIYTRMSEINKLLEQQKRYNKETQHVQVEQLQEQGFALLDAANKLESDGRFEDAIQQYMSAISILAQAGWSETQLENIKSKVMKLAQDIDRKKQIQQQKELRYKQQQAQGMTQTSRPQMMGMPSAAPVDPKAAALQSFEEKKRREEAMQDQAFSHIDNAKMFEKEKNFDGAIMNYEKAIELLNVLGWTQQTQNLQVVVEKLRRDKITHERATSQQQMLSQQQAMRVEESQAAVSQEPQELQMFKLMEYEGKKKKEEETQTKAFNLIDIGKRLEREKKYDEAIVEFQKAIELLRSIQWESYVHPIVNFIKDIELKKKREIKTEETRSKRQKELTSLQSTIKTKQKEQFVQSSQELELKRREFEAKKAEDIKIEEELFSFLEDADDSFQQRNYDEALEKYEYALNTLNELGSRWKSYIPAIQNTIKSVQQAKKRLNLKDAEIQKRTEERKEREIEFQEKIAGQLKIERIKLQKKTIASKVRDDDVKHREQRKEIAFKFLDTAQTYIKQGDYEKAIHAYQNAGNIFAEIQWTEEISLIEGSIKELEQKQKERQERKMKEMQHAIERQKSERDFQDQIKGQLRNEREKLKGRQIILREQKKEQEYRERRKEDGFKLLDEAQILLDQGDFDKALELYRETANIFAEIQWQDEINIIQNSIIEIENKKKEAALRKQREFQAGLVRKKQEEEFQVKALNEMKVHRKSLQQRQVQLREKEKELQHLENRRIEAFKQIDVANKLLNEGNFDDALNVYHEVLNIFAEIQWTDEISLIKQSILEIETKKKEKTLIEQRRFTERIQNETNQQAFIDQIKHQRELENARIKENQELSSKQQEIMRAHMARQKEAFKLIDDGDILLKQEKFDDVISAYQKAIEILKQLGWEASYLKVLEENLVAIQAKKVEKEKERQIIDDKRQKQEQEAEQFQQRISQSMIQEKEKLKAKKIQIQKLEARKQLTETVKSEAFKLMDDAEGLLSQHQYEQSIEKYRQAELMLCEIQFPTDSIKEMVYKIQDKKRAEDIAKQHKLEAQLKRQQDDSVFKEQISERMRLEQQKMQVKQVQTKKYEDLKVHLEKRKEDAFNLLDEAEKFMAQVKYDKALEYYRSAELILNEIQFPTDVIKGMIMKVQEKKRDKELNKQRELEFQLQRAREEEVFQSQLEENYNNERDRLKFKHVEIRKREEVQLILENRKQDAFKILDDAESFTKKMDYVQALEKYRKAEIILNELEFPTNSIKNMITKIISLKKQKETQEEFSLQIQLERLKEQEEIQVIIQDRQKQEKERKVAQQNALQEREKLVQQQVSIREASFSLLDEAGKALKSFAPDYERAISLYIQARDLLAQAIGWEPEIKHLNELISDLQKEKAERDRRKQLEAEISLERQEEYEIFQEELKKRKLEVEQQRQDQISKFRAFEQQKQLTEDIRDEGMNFIDQGKRFAELHNFPKSYESFKNAMDKFKEIGWTAQIRYIENEIRNTQGLEKQAHQEELEMQRIQDELEKQRKLEVIKRKEEDERTQQNIGEIGSLADEVNQLLKVKKQELKLSEQQQKEKLKSEAMDFGKDMGNILKIKQELFSELKKNKDSEKEKAEEQQKSKEQDEMDDITRMIKEAAKKK